MKTYTKEQVKAMKTADIVKAYNEVTGGSVKKFASRGVAEKRLVAACSGEGAVKPAKAPKSGKEKAQVNGQARASFNDLVNLEAVENPKSLQYRPTSPRGQVIEAASAEGGADMKALCKLVGKDRQGVVGLLRAINKSNGCAVTESEDNIVHVDATGLTGRKLFNYEKHAEVVPPREGSKRARIVEFLRKGATLDEVVEEFEYSKNPERASEALGCLHAVHGYGLSEDDNGVIKIQG
mgnify:FL=1